MMLVLDKQRPITKNSRIIHPNIDKISLTVHANIFYSYTFHNKRSFGSKFIYKPTLINIRWIILNSWGKNSKYLLWLKYITS